MFRATRLVLYPLFFACSTVLLGLTAYRIHYTKSLDHPDVLTTRTHFYDPRIAALMTASIVGVIFSLVILGTLLASVDMVVVGEHLGIWILWIFFLITAALVTKQFSNLKWCRSHHKVCSVLETIKAFGWICWGLLSILLVVTLIKLLLDGTGNRTNRGYSGTPTRQTTTTPVTATDPHSQPASRSQQPQPGQKTNPQNTQPPHQPTTTTTSAQGIGDTRTTSNIV